MELASPQRLAACLGQMTEGLLERDTAASLLLLGALAGEHTLLIGPPGTAKSELARRLRRCFADTTYFERLLTRFTTPEELFGPLSLKALEDDRYERLVQGFLPCAGIVFLDEVFKAHSAILNTLLGVLNERRFDNGQQVLQVPLISLVGASNETPDDSSLAAFHDRFLLQVPVEPVSDAAFVQLLTLPPSGSPAAPAPAPWRSEERAALKQASESVSLDEAVAQGLYRLRGWLAGQGWGLSDRRWRQWLGLMRVAAAAEGRAAIDLIDLWTAPYVVGADPDTQTGVREWVAHTLLDIRPWPLEGFERAVQAFEAQLHLEATLPAEGAAAPDDAAGKMSLARGQSGHPGPEGHADAPAEPLRLSAPAAERRNRRHFSRLHIDARLAELRALQLRIEARLAQAEQAWQELSHQLSGRCWPPAPVKAAWLATRRANRYALQQLHQQAQTLHEGFANLPLDAHSQAAPAPAVTWPEPAIPAAA